MLKVKIFLGLLVVMFLIALSASWAQQSQTDPAGMAESMPAIFGGLEDPAASAQAFGLLFRLAFRFWPLFVVWAVIQYFRGYNSRQ